MWSDSMVKPVLAKLDPGLISSWPKLQAKTDHN